MSQSSACQTASSARFSVSDIEALFNLPFNDLIFRAAQVHRENFDPNKVQLSTLLSIKTGGCPEDCAYCPQSAHYQTGVNRHALLNAGRKARNGENGFAGFTIRRVFGNLPIAVHVFYPEFVE